MGNSASSEQGNSTRVGVKDFMSISTPNMQSMAEFVVFTNWLVYREQARAGQAQVECDIEQVKMTLDPFNSDVIERFARAVDNKYLVNPEAAKKVKTFVRDTFCTPPIDAIMMGETQLSKMLDAAISRSVEKVSAVVHAIASGADSDKIDEFFQAIQMAKMNEIDPEGEYTEIQEAAVMVTAHSKDLFKSAGHLSRALCTFRRAMERKDADGFDSSSTKGVKQRLEAFAPKFERLDDILNLRAPPENLISLRNALDNFEHLFDEGEMNFSGVQIDLQTITEEEKAAVRDAMLDLLQYTIPTDTINGAFLGRAICVENLTNPKDMNERVVSAKFLDGEHNAKHAGASGLLVVGWVIGVRTYAQCVTKFMLRVMVDASGNHSVGIYFKGEGICFPLAASPNLVRADHPNIILRMMSNARMKMAKRKDSIKKSDPRAGKPENSPVCVKAVAQLEMAVIFEPMVKVREAYAELTRVFEEWARGTRNPARERDMQEGIYENVQPVAMKFF